MIYISFLLLSLLHPNLSLSLHHKKKLIKPSNISSNQL